MTNTTYVLDLTGVTTEDALHDVLQNALPLPDHYGRNLDALHDCLTDLAASASEEEPLHITVCGYKSAKKALEHYFYAFRSVLNDTSEADPSLTVTWRRKA